MLQPTVIEDLIVGGTAGAAAAAATTPLDVVKTVRGFSGGNCLCIGLCQISGPHSANYPVQCNSNMRIDMSDVLLR